MCNELIKNKKNKDNSKWQGPQKAFKIDFSKLLFIFKDDYMKIMVKMIILQTYREYLNPGRQTEYEFSLRFRN